MSELSFAELEHFYCEAIDLLAELQEQKLLKKLPSSISKRALKLLKLYGKRNEGVTVLIEESPTNDSYDSRRECDATMPSCNSADITSPWWQGNVEVKGLLKGHKQTKLYCIAHDSLLSFFVGNKKKPLKGQVVLSPKTEIDMVSEGKKRGNILTLTEEDCRTVTLKFVSAEDGLAWYNFYKETCTQDDDIYEDTEAMPSTPDEMSGDGDAAKCRSIVSDEGQSLSQSTEEMGGTDRGADKVSDSSASESRHFSDSPQPSSDEITRHTTDSAPKLITEDIKLEDKIAVLDEETPNLWGNFEFGDVYQTEWSFNLSKSVLADQGLLSLLRGQLVLVKHQVNSDWWKVLDCQGNEGFVASCYLSLAYY